MNWRHYHLTDYLFGIHGHFSPFKSLSDILSANAGMCAEPLSSKPQGNIIRKKKQPLEGEKKGYNTLEN